VPTLVLLCSAQFVVVLDVTIVAVALPTLQRELGFAAPDLQWVVTSYTLCFAALLTVAGRAADLWGRRRLFGAGLGLFAAASLGCALSERAELLVAMRAVQGCGAAALSAAALALLTATFPSGGGRERAVACWTAAAAGGGASGWVLGGAITERLGWESIFLVNVPVGLLALAAAPALLRESRDEAASRRLDLLGALTLAAGLAALVFGFTRAQRSGWSSPDALVPLGAAAALLVAFWRHESSAEAPLLPLADLRRPGLASACAAALFLTATTTPAMFLAVLLQQHVLGYSPAQAGLGSAPFNVAVIAGSAAGPALARLAGPRGAMAGGLAGVGAGACVLAATGAGSGYAQLLVAFALMGASLGCASVASTALGTAALATDRQGLAAGLLGTAAQVGTVLGLAAFIPLAAARSATTGDLAEGYAWAQAGVALAALAAVALLCLASRPWGYTQRGFAAGNGRKDSREEGPRRSPVRRGLR
jgi:EmrB/QacA subfamily drug resistance transporter